jgi:hypothetical protein
MVQPKNHHMQRFAVNDPGRRTALARRLPGRARW